MSAASRVVVALVALAVAAGAGALVVVALAAGERPAVIQLQSGSAAPTATPAPGSGEPAEPDDRPLWPEEARQARRAALTMTGGGTVSELDRSDDPGEAYEVEVIREGREYDVALDLDFHPVPNRRYDD
jgi:hypothetical protein